MDPEVVSSLNEQIRQLNEMLSRQAVAMSGLAKSMASSAAPALKNASDATRKSTSAQDANSATVGKMGESVTKLEQIRQQSNKNMMDAVKNFSDAAMSSGQALRSFADKLLSSEEGFTKYGDSVSSLGDAAFSLGKSFGPLGFIFGGILNIGSKVLAYQLKQADALYKASDDIAKMGAAGTFTVEQIRRMGANAGLTSFELDKLIVPMKSVEGGFIGLGGTQSDGIKRFGELANVSVGVRNEFRRLGMGDQERNQALANYITMMNKSGAAFSGNLKTQQGLQKAALNYTRSLYELAELTGKDVDTLAKERNAQMETIEVALIQNKWAEEEAEATKRKQEAKTSAEREAAQKDLNRIQRDKAAFDKLNKDLDMSAANAEYKNAIRQQFLTGKVTAETAKMKAAGLDVDKYLENLRSGKAKQGEFAQAINTSLQKSMDNVGQNVLGMNDEVLKLYGLDQETIARLTIMMKYDMRTQAAEAMAAIKANQEGTGAAANDPMQQMRDKKVEAERKAKLMVDELAASMNPLLGNDGMLKAFAGIAAAAAAGLGLLAAAKGLSMLTKLFRKGPVESAVGASAASDAVSVSEDQLLDKNGKPLKGAARDARIAKLSGGKTATITEPKKGVTGAIKGIAESLKQAGKAAPSVIKGGAALAAAVAEIGAGLAAATWIMGNVLPTFADGIKAFKGIEAKNLIDVGLGMAALGLGVVGMFAGTVAAAFSKLIEFVSGGQDPLSEIGNMLFRMQMLQLDPDRIEQNGKALATFASAMASISKLSSTGNLSDSVDQLAEAINSMFKDKAPFDQMVNFSKLNIDLEKTKNNSNAFKYFTDAMSSYEGLGSDAGQIGTAISEGVTGFFDATPPIEQFVEFSKLKIDAKRTKNNATAFKLFAEAMASYKGLGSAVSAISANLANATARFFGVRPPLEEAVYFSHLDINRKRTEINAKAFVSFSHAMSSYKGGPGLLDAVSTIAASKLYTLFETKGPIESFKEFTELKIGDNASKNSQAFLNFAKAIGILTGSGPSVLDTAIDAGGDLLSSLGSTISDAGKAVISAFDFTKAKGSWKQDTSFIKEVNRVAAKYNFSPGALIGLMMSESGIDPQARNPNGGATGLIQFMPATARALGTSTAALYKMNRTEQMKYVDAFFAPHAKGLNNASPGKLYAYVFLPGRAHRDVLTTSNEKYYKANPGLDTNKDGKITISDLDKRVLKKAQQARYGGIFTGPKTGYPMELHGTEMVIPVTTNSVLTKLAKSANDVSNMTFSALRKATDKGAKAKEQADANFLSTEMIFNLAKKFDNVISVLQENDSTQNKILKHSMS